MHKLTNWRASEVLDELYKKAAMEVPSAEEKKTEHIPETHIDKAVADKEKEKRLLMVSKKCCGK